MEAPINSVKEVSTTSVNFDGTTVILSLLATIIGAIISFICINAYQNRKDKKIRKIATKGLNIFLKYANGANTYEETKNDFNTSLNITEKRIILVCFHKIGIPIRFSSDKVFNMKNIEFEKNIIDTNEINNMILQIESGNCDKLFFLDADTYFSENSRIKILRILGVKFVNEVLRKSTMNANLSSFNFPDKWQDNFSYGELNAITAFKNEILSDYYCDKSTLNLVKEKLDKLIGEIELGLWDDFLLTNIKNYLNHLNTSQLIQQNLTPIPNNIGSEAPNNN